MSVGVRGNCMLCAFVKLPVSVTLKAYEWDCGQIYGRKDQQKKKIVIDLI